MAQAPIDVKKLKRTKLPSERMPLESDIESAVCRYARANNVLAYKFTSPGHRSVPDRIFIFPSGKVVFIEFKRPGNRPTEAQVGEIKKLRDKLQQVYWTDNVESGKGIIDWYLGRHA